MDAQIRRLAMLVACTTMIACVSISAWYFYRAHELQVAIRETHIAMSKWYSACERERHGEHCQWARALNTTFDDLVILRDSHEAIATTLIWLGFGIPVAVAFILFGRQWVKTGNLCQTDASRTKEPRPQATTRRNSQHRMLITRSLWVIGGFLCVGLLFVFGSERTYETLFSSVVQVLVLAFVVWIIGKIQKMISRRSGSKNER